MEVLELHHQDPCKGLELKAFKNSWNAEGCSTYHYYYYYYCYYYYHHHIAFLLWIIYGLC
jgi:hypothetical protein